MSENFRFKFAFLKKRPILKSREDRVQGRRREFRPDIRERPVVDEIIKSVGAAERFQGRQTVFVEPSAVGDETFVSGDDRRPVFSTDAGPRVVDVLIIMLLCSRLTGRRLLLFEPPTLEEKGGDLAFRDQDPHAGKEGLQQFLRQPALIMQGQNEMPDPRSEKRAVIALRQARFVGLFFARGIIPLDLELDIIRQDLDILDEDLSGSLKDGVFGQNPLVDGQPFSSGHDDRLSGLSPKSGLAFLPFGRLVRDGRLKSGPSFFASQPA